VVIILHCRYDDDLDHLFCVICIGVIYLHIVNFTCERVYFTTGQLLYEVSDSASAYGGSIYLMINRISPPSEATIIVFRQCTWFNTLMSVKSANHDATGIGIDLAFDTWLTTYRILMMDSCQFMRSLGRMLALGSATASASVSVQMINPSMSLRSYVYISNSQWFDVRVDAEAPGEKTCLVGAYNENTLGQDSDPVTYYFFCLFSRSSCVFQ
jgi:hypothetical protein